MRGNPSMIKRSVRLAGHATSIALEPAFWQALRAIAARRRMSVNTLLSTIDAERTGNLASAARVFVLECCQRGEFGDAPPPIEG